MLLALRRWDLHWFPILHPSCYARCRGDVYAAHSNFPTPSPTKRRVTRRPDTADLEPTSDADQYKLKTIL